MSAESSTARIFLSIALSPAAVRSSVAASTRPRERARPNEAARSRYRFVSPKGGSVQCRGQGRFLAVARSGPRTTAQANAEPAPYRAWRTHRTDRRAAHVELHIAEVLAGQEEADPLVEGMPENRVERPVPAQAQRVEVVVVLRRAEAGLHPEGESVGVVVAELRPSLPPRDLRHALAHQGELGRGEHARVEQGEPGGEDEPRAHPRLRVGLDATRPDLPEVAALSGDEAGGTGEGDVRDGVRRVHDESGPAQGDGIAEADQHPRFAPGGALGAQV